MRAGQTGHRDGGRARIYRTQRVYALRFGQRAHAHPLREKRGFRASPQRSRRSVRGESADDPRALVPPELSGPDCGRESGRWSGGCCRRPRSPEDTSERRVGMGPTLLAGGAIALTVARWMLAGLMSVLESVV